MLSCVWLWKPETVWKRQTYCVHCRSMCLQYVLFSIQTHRLGDYHKKNFSCLNISMKFLALMDGFVTFVCRCFHSNRRLSSMIIKDFICLCDGIPFQLLLYVQYYQSTLFQVHFFHSPSLWFFFCTLQASQGSLVHVFHSCPSIWKKWDPLEGLVFTGKA